MKFSENWLRSHVPTSATREQLVATLTAIGLEVEEVTALGDSLDGVVVAQILSAEKHPEADRLQVCQVDAGQGRTVQIVCGAPNARAGLKAPLAMVGATLPGGLAISAARLRGVESSGMLCSAKELGVDQDASGLLELPDDAPVGVALAGFLGLPDASIEIKLTPNRADCFGVRGIAFDVAAATASAVAEFDPAPVAATSDAQLAIQLDAGADAPRYCGRVIEGVDATRPTPAWMAERLRRSGVRPLSLLVDVTQYVMLELGQPLHAFDRDLLQGPVGVRRARTGETLTLLDSREVALDPEFLVVTDAGSAVALAGIMGGLDTRVTDATRRVFLESAHFAPDAIIGRGRKLGLHTDAAHRFERGVDPQLPRTAIEYATRLILDAAGGEPGPVVEAALPAHLPQPQPILLRRSRLQRVLGARIEDVAVERILRALGMAVAANGEGWQVTAPSRRFDIAIEEDLIEEVARIHGYDAIPEAPVSGELAVGSVSGHRVAPGRLRQELCAAGYQEAVNYSFIDRRLLAAVHQDDHVLPLANPLSADLDVMRTTLLPGLLSALGRNLRRQQGRVRLFETGKVFLQKDQLSEIERVAAVASGEALPEQWGVPARPLDFFDVKGDVERVLSLRGGSLRGADLGPVFEPATLPWLHPGAAAVIKVQDRVVGWCGAVHPVVLKGLDIRKAVFGFELDLEPVLQREIPFAKEISRFPSIRRDLALLLPNDVSYDQVRRSSAAAAGPLLEKVVVFDVYEGGNLKEGYKSVAIGLIFNDVSSTLRDEDVDPLIEAVVSELGQRLGAQLRG